MAITYVVRPGYSSPTGTIFVSDFRSYDVGAGLSSGSGVITVPDTDYLLIDALDRYTPLERSSVDVVPAWATKSYIPLYALVDQTTDPGVDEVFRRRDGRFEVVSASGTGTSGTSSVLDVTQSPYNAAGVAGTSSRAALVAAITAAAGRPIYLPTGTYDITSIAVAAGTPVNLVGDGSGATIIRGPATAQGTALLSFTGSAAGATAAYSLTANATEGATLITVSSANATTLSLAAGDYLHVWSNKVWPTTVDQSAVQGETVRVQSVNTSTGVITLWGTLADTYLTSDTARVRKLSLTSGCSLSGIKFVNTAPLTGGSSMVMATWTLGFRTRDVEISNADGPGIHLVDSHGFDVEARIRDSADDAGNSRFGYGVFFFGSCQNGRALVDADRCRHAVTTGASRLSSYATNPAQTGVPRHIDVYGIARNTTSAAWDTHSEGEDIRFRAVAAHGCQTAFQTRAPHTLLESWDFTDCRDASYVPWTASGTTILAGRSRATKSGNGTAFVLGSVTGGTLSNVRIDGLHSEDEAVNAVRLINCDDIVIKDSFVRNVASGAGDCFYVDTGCTNIRFINPSGENALRLINMDPSITAGNVIVDGNVTLVNVSRISDDGTIEYQRRSRTMVNSSLGAKVWGARRDDFGSNRDTVDRLMVDSQGVMWGSHDGATAASMRLYPRTSRQWGVDGELRGSPSVPADTVLSSRIGTTGTGTLVSGTNTITGVVSVSGGSLATTQTITGTGIPSSTTITGISGTTLTISNNATANGTVSWSTIETTNRWFMDGRGFLFAGDGATSASQMYSRNATTGEFEIDASNFIAAAFRLHGTSVTTTPYSVVAGDVLLRVNTSSAKTLNLTATTGNSIGRLLIIKDETGSAATNNITVTPATGESIDGGAANASLTPTMNTNRQCVILYAVSGGWMRIM